MAILSNTGIRAGASAAGGGYQIEKSLRFNEPDDAKLSRTFTSAGDQQKFTLSFWFKNCDEGNSNSKMLFCLDNSGSSQLEMYDGRLATWFYSPDGSTWAVGMSTATTHLFRDPSAWYHIVLSIDTTAGTTNADRQKIYINGEQLTLTFDTYWGGLMTGDVKGWNTADEHFIGMRGSSYGGNWLCAEYYFIDGQGLDASSFGETDSTTGKWIPKKYAGDYNVSETLSLRNTVNNEALDVVVNRVVDKCWIKSDGNWIGGGNPSNTSSEPTFHLLNGAAAANLYWHTTAYEGAHTITIGSSSESGTQPAWASSSGSFSTTSTVASGTFSSSYGHARTGALADDTVYAFTFTIDASANTCNHTGWFINDDTAYVQGVPDEQTGDSGSTSLNNVGCRWYAGTTDFSDGGYWEWIACRGAFQAIQTIPVVTNSHSYPVLGGTGLNSFYLKFNGTDLGEDSSGNGNDWTATNLAADTSFGSLTGSDGNAPEKYATGAFSGATAATANFHRPNGNGNNEYLTWTPSAPHTAGSTLKVYLDVAAKTGTRGLYVNGSDVTSHVTVTENTPVTNVDEWSVNLSAASITSVTSVATLDVDVSTDTPTDFDDGGNGTGNYATLNPLYTTNATLTQGNLSITSSSGYAEAHSTQIMTSGKWYMEFAYTKNTGDYITFGIGQSNRVLAPGDGVIHRSEDYGWKAWVGATKSMSGGSIIYDYSSSNPLVDGQIISLAFDADNGKLWCALNGTWITNGSGQGNPATGANPDYSGLDYSGGYQFQAGPYNNANLTANFGARAFAYTPPTDYKALNTYNLPDPVITDPSKYFEAKTYTGTGSALNITGLNFKPDLVWIKNRSTAYSHCWYDAVRGVGKRLACEGTYAEDTYNLLTAFTDDGFTLGSGFVQNASGETHVSWNWDAGTADTVVEYDNSDTWSDDVTNVDSSYPATRAFDGYDSTTCYATAGTTAVFTPASAISGDVYVMAYAYQAGGTYSKLKVNGTDYTSLFGTTWWQWVPVPETSLTNLSFGGDDGSHYVGLLAVRVGDKLLLDSAASTADLPSVHGGGLATSLIDKSQTWSTAGTTTGSTYSGYSWSGVFNEKAPHTPFLYTGTGTGNAVHNATSGSTTKYTFAGSGLTGVTSVKLSSVDYNDGQLILNEGESDEVVFTGSQYNVQTIYEDTTITTLKSVSVKGISGIGHALFGIIVNGKALIDSGNSYTIPHRASTYRANPSAGFSIVKYYASGAVNQSMAHGLNTKPDFMIFKSRDSAANWNTWHKDYTTDQQKVLYLNLDSAGAAYSGGSSTWWYASPDSNVFWYGEYGSSINMSNGDQMIAFCWSEVAGYSKFGGWTGNGSTDGPFVYCGFEPAYILLKCTSHGESWIILDNKRDTYNEVEKGIYANLTNAEASGGFVDTDFLSNGFKLRADGSIINGSSKTYVFAAFAESPFKYNNAR